MCIYKDVHMSRCLCTYVYIHTCIHTYTCMHTYMHTQTYIIPHTDTHDIHTCILRQQEQREATASQLECQTRSPSHMPQRNDAARWVAVHERDSDPMGVWIMMKENTQVKTNPKPQTLNSQTLNP